MRSREVQALDPVKTAPFELGPREASRACLLIHGFTGSPWEVRPLGEHLAAQGWFVRGIRLPGHGQTPEAMRHVGHADWEQAAEEGLLSLERYPRVCAAGLSMGALLSVLLAARLPDRLRALALMAPAVQFRGPSMRLVQSMGRVPLLEVLRPWVFKHGTDLEDDDARAEAPVLRAFPMARFHDLLTLRALALREATRVRTPALVVAAANDHVVSVGGARRLAKALDRAAEVQLTILERGFHILPRDTGRAALFAEVEGFFDRWTV